MERYMINGANMRTREDAHAEIARALQLPAHYGRNLDALWDVLGGMGGEIVLLHGAELLNALQGYGCKLLETLYDAAEENPKLSFRIDA